MTAVPVSLLIALGAFSEEARRPVVDSLVARGPDAIESVDVVLRDGNWQARFSGVDVLERLGDVDKLYDVANGHARTEVRRHAIDALSRVAPRDECGRMRALLEREPGLTLTALGRLGCDMDIVRRSFAAKDPDVRRRAVMAYGVATRGDETAKLGPLVELLWDSDRMVRTAASQALVSSLRGVAVLLASIQELSGPLRVTAIRALVGRTPGAAIIQLARELGRAPWPERAALVDVLGHSAIGRDVLRRRRRHENHALVLSRIDAALGMP